MAGLRINLRIAMAAALIAAGVAFVRSPGLAYAGEPAVVIEMNDSAPFFSPAKVTARVGEPVQWVNAGQAVHSVTTDSTLRYRDRKDTSKPRGAKAFDSGFIPPGGNYTYTFTVPGTYRYFCLLYEKAGMIGVVTVRR